MPIDYSKYPSAWKQIREAILRRENNRCKFCKLQNHAIIMRLGDNDFRTPSTVEWDMIRSRVKYSKSSIAESLKYHGFIRVVLTVAHLDQDINNNEYSNLAALCQKCHLIHDKEQHRENRNKTLQEKKKQISLF